MSKDWSEGDCSNIAQINANLYLPKIGGDASVLSSQSQMDCG